MSRIGIVGYGQMGAAMGPLLASAGHTVVATDIDAERRTVARKAGQLGDEAEVYSAEVVILALPGPVEVRVATADRFAAGQLVIDTTSIDPPTAKDVAESIARRGAAYVEAPVLGGPPQAGRWVFLFGGADGDIQRAESFLRSVGSGEHFGAVGKGSEAKLLNNILTGVHGAIVGEILRITQRQGTDVGLLQRAIMRSESAGRNPVLEIRVPKILNGTLGDTFSIDNMVKDLRLALELDGAQATEPTVTRAAFDHFVEAQRRGWGKRDIGYLAAALEPRAEPNSPPAHMT